MKILHVEVDAVLSKGDQEKIEKRLNECINNGILITDNFIKAKVIEFDEMNVTESKPKSKDKTYSARYTCLECDHEEIVRHQRKSEFREIEPCPKCNSLIVDLRYYPKYEHLKRS